MKPVACVQSNIPNLGCRLCLCVSPEISLSTLSYRTETRNKKSVVKRTNTHRQPGASEIRACAKVGAVGNFVCCTSLGVGHSHV